MAALYPSSNGLPSPLGFDSPSNLQSSSPYVEDTLDHREPWDEFIDMRIYEQDSPSWDQHLPSSPRVPAGFSPLGQVEYHQYHQPSLDNIHSLSPPDTSVVLTPTSDSFDRHEIDDGEVERSPYSNFSSTEEYVMSSPSDDESRFGIRSTAIDQAASISGTVRQQLFHNAALPQSQVQSTHINLPSRTAINQPAHTMNTALPADDDILDPTDELDPLGAAFIANNTSSFHDASAANSSELDRQNAQIPYRHIVGGPFTVPYLQYHRHAVLGASHTVSLPPSMLHQPHPPYLEQQPPHAYHTEVFIPASMVVPAHSPMAIATIPPQSYPHTPMTHVPPPIRLQHPTIDITQQFPSRQTEPVSNFPRQGETRSPNTAVHQTPLSSARPPVRRRNLGGRTPGVHLPEYSRKKSHNMRRIGACWRCALQRDPCDGGSPCQRCSMQSQRGQTYFFQCERSKLPEFVHDFLPPTMTFVHQKQSIEDCVSEQVMTWHRSQHVDLHLSCGYGPPLRWTVYEFSPRTPELLQQFQYFQDAATGQSKLHIKYSPPYGLMKIDTSDEVHLEDYLCQLLDEQFLPKFGNNCYEEESQVDEDKFQAKLLALMCRLYLSTSENEADLKPVLRDVIRMIVITFIMGHTLTITEDTLGAVISSVRYTTPPIRSGKHISPRLANRQLKFFLNILRQNIYAKILKWQQSALHLAGNRTETWLQSFCVILGFAMVLEEVQRTLLIQADACVQKGEADGEKAVKEARNACGRIDERFKLLIGLFQCKYRDRRWGSNGSFGPGTPELEDPIKRDTLRRMRHLVEERRDHLQRRADVQFSIENQCLYTTRLTAQFLLPFLKLP